MAEGSIKVVTKFGHKGSIESSFKGGFMKVFLSAVIAAVIMDFLWLGLIMSRFYQSQLHPLLRLDSDGRMAPIWWSAGVVYLFIPLGVVLFVLPRIDPLSYMSAFIWGFVFGVTLYGVYEFTNLSLLHQWPWKVVLIDTLWGGMLCGVVSVVASWVQQS